MSLRTLIVVACDRPGCPETAPPESTQQRAEATADAVGFTRTPHTIQGQQASWRHLCPRHSGGFA